MRAVVLGGLVILSGPLCLTAAAQEYIDLEAERAAGAPAPSTAPADPYGVRPAQAYPAARFGASASSPATLAAPATATAVTGAQPASQNNLGNLFYQVQQLQQEVMRLNGKVEEQTHELSTLKAQNLERYIDLDKRLTATATAAVGAATAPAAAATGPAAAAPAVVAQSQAAEQPGEGEAYRAAYALVRSQQFDQAIKAFRQFQQNYPGGRYAPNAYYWLGELYLVAQPPDLESSRQSFTMLLSIYPDDNKAPDALYKLGKVQFMKGNREKAREYLDQVISKYGATTNSAAVKLAKDFIAENY